MSQHPTTVKSTADSITTRDLSRRVIPQLSTILTINAGSSSIKFALYETGSSLRRTMDGKIDRIGLSGTIFAVHDPYGKSQCSHRIQADTHGSAANHLLHYLAVQPVFSSIKAVGHRVVHGMKHSKPQRVSTALLAELHRLAPYDPDHLPREIELIQAFRQQYPKLPQVACFDTAFHHTMPPIAKLLPIPRRYAAKGIRRYGFHGLSYAFLMEELVRLGDPAAKKGRVILAHLGNGASLAAIRDGQSIDTSMGFTPAAGLMMSTRSGDLDPGIVSYLARIENLTTVQFEHMINHDSGLLGVSGTSPDVRDLLAKEATDRRAALALDMFCYQAKKWIGAFAAALGGVDTLVFAGGIGENSPVIRQRICQDLAFLGIRLNGSRNMKNAPLISAPDAAVSVRVIHTDEDLMIARSVVRLLKVQMKGK
ncbi:MAG: acetate/propionate family kinase [Phycisphaerae bacterium]